VTEDADPPARIFGAGDSGDDPLVHIALLAKHFDAKAVRKLARWFSHDDPRVRDAAARAFARYHPFGTEWAGLIPALSDERFAVEESLARIPMRVAARAAIAALPPDDLADLLEPLLADSALATAHGRVRAEEILDELEEALARAFLRSHESEEDEDHDEANFPTRPPAPLLATRCDELALRADRIGTRARMCRDGYRAHVGWFVAAPFTEIHLGEGNDPPFPCALAGFVMPPGLPRSRVYDAITSLDPPFGLGYFHHATGGIALHYQRLVGYLVTLTNAQKKAVATIATAVGHTAGDAISDEQRLASNSALASIAPGGIESGKEALLVGAPSSPLTSLRNHVALVARPAVVWREYVHEVDKNTFEADGVYDEAREAALVSVGTALDIGDPRVLLLWGNSD
jgi:hypothetical protein